MSEGIDHRIEISPEFREMLETTPLFSSEILFFILTIICLCLMRIGKKGRTHFAVQAGAKIQGRKYTVRFSPSLPDL
jgi:hypothetical protein